MHAGLANMARGKFGKGMSDRPMRQSSPLYVPDYRMPSPSSSPSRMQWHKRNTSPLWARPLYSPPRSPYDMLPDPVDNHMNAAPYSPSRRFNRGVIIRRGRSPSPMPSGRVPAHDWQEPWGRFPSPWANLPSRRSRSLSPRWQGSHDPRVYSPEGRLLSPRAVDMLTRAAWESPSNKSRPRDHLPGFSSCRPAGKRRHFKEGLPSSRAVAGRVRRIGTRPDSVLRSPAKQHRSSPDSKPLTRPKAQQNRPSAQHASSSLHHLLPSTTLPLPHVRNTADAARYNPVLLSPASLATKSKSKATVSPGPSVHSSTVSLLRTTDHIPGSPITTVQSARDPRAQANTMPKDPHVQAKITPKDLPAQAITRPKDPRLQARNMPTDPRLQARSMPKDPHAHAKTTAKDESLSRGNSEVPSVDCSPIEGLGQHGPGSHAKQTNIQAISCNSKAVLSKSPDAACTAPPAGQPPGSSNKRLTVKSLFGDARQDVRLLKQVLCKQVRADQDALDSCPASDADTPTNDSCQDTFDHVLQSVTDCDSSCPDSLQPARLRSMPPARFAKHTDASIGLQHGSPNPTALSKLEVATAAQTSDKPLHSNCSPVQQSEQPPNRMQGRGFAAAASVAHHVRVSGDTAGSLPYIAPITEQQAVVDSKVVDSTAVESKAVDSKAVDSKALDSKMKLCAEIIASGGALELEDSCWSYIDPKVSIIYAYACHAGSSALGSDHIVTLQLYKRVSSSSLVGNQAIA